MPISRTLIVPMPARRSPVLHEAAQVFGLRAARLEASETIRPEAMQGRRP
jgi:hypothetical protein